MSDYYYQLFIKLNMYKILLLLFFFIFFDSPFLFAKEKLIVKSVVISETSVNSTLAKKKAIEFGKRKAFYEIIQTIEPNANNKSLDEITNKEIQNSIMSFSILSEKITKNSYKATLEYVFSQYMLHSLLKKILKNTEKRSMLIIPVLKIKNKLSIWENDWFYSWSKNFNKKIKIIEEEINSINYLNLQVLDDYNLNIETKLKKQYKVDEVFLIQLEIPSSEEIMITFLSNTATNIEKINYSLDSFFATASKEEIFDSLVKHCLIYIENLNLKFKHNLKIIEDNTTKYTILVKDLSDWYFIANNVIHDLNYNIRYLSKDIIISEVKWNGDLQSLHNHIAENKDVIVSSYTGLLEIKVTN